MLTARLVVLALLACSLSSVSAFPWLWAGEAKTCTSHPTTPEAGHAAPVRDTRILFSVTDAKGASVTDGKGACPGATYTVTVKFPQVRLGLVTTTVGTLGDGKQDIGKCANRALTARSRAAGGPSTSITTTWAVPCNARGSATVMVTSAMGMQGGFLQNMASVPIAAATACKSTCRSG